MMPGARSPAGASPTATTRALARYSASRTCGASGGRTTAENVAPSSSERHAAPSPKTSTAGGSAAIAVAGPGNERGARVGSPGRPMPSVSGLSNANTRPSTSAAVRRPACPHVNAAGVNVSPASSDQAAGAASPAHARWTLDAVSTRRTPGLRTPAARENAPRPCCVRRPPSASYTTSRLAASSNAKATGRAPWSHRRGAPSPGATGGAVRGQAVGTTGSATSGVGAPGPSAGQAGASGGVGVACPTAGRGHASGPRAGGEGVSSAGGRGVGARPGTARGTGGRTSASPQPPEATARPRMAVAPRRPPMLMKNDPTPSTRRVPRFRRVWGSSRPDRGRPPSADP
jgi:hypothetical protein